MPTIIYAPNAELQQIDDFPDDCERSVKGALHVRPGATATVSDAEAEHLKKRGVVFRATGAPAPKKNDAAPQGPEGAAGDQPAQGVVAPSAGLLSADTEQEAGKKQGRQRGGRARSDEEPGTVFPRDDEESHK